MLKVYNILIKEDVLKTILEKISINQHNDKYLNKIINNLNNLKKRIILLKYIKYMKGFGL